jgi:rod shape-determining protein MreC
VKKMTLTALSLLVFLVLVPGAYRAWQVWRSGDQAPDAKPSTAQNVLAPLARLTSWGGRSVSEALEYITTTGQLRRREKVLEAELTRLKAENDTQAAALARYERLGGTAFLAESRGWRYVAASAVAYGDRSYRSLLINRGAQDGIRLGDPVLHMEGLAGVISRVARDTATVQLLYDPAIRVGCVVLPQRIQGWVRGTSDENALEIVLRDRQVDLQPGQRVETSGLFGSLYPAGLLIGTVGGTGQNLAGQVVADVTPAVSFGFIEDVLVLLVRQNDNLDLTPNLPAAPVTTQTVPNAPVPAPVALTPPPAGAP